MATEESAETAPEAAREISPLEQLTTLVLDAADAANETAQTSTESMAGLAKAVAELERAAESVRFSPAIAGTVTLAIGIIFAIGSGIVGYRMLQKIDSLDVALSTSEQRLARIDGTLRTLGTLEPTLERLEKLDDTVLDRALTTLREQIRNDRVELARADEEKLRKILAEARPVAATASPPASVRGGSESDIRSLQAGITRIESRNNSAAQSLLEMEKRLSQFAPRSGSEERAAVASESIRVEIAALRAEVAELAVLLEQRIPKAAPPVTGPVYQRQQQP